MTVRAFDSPNPGEKIMVEPIAMFGKLEVSKG